MIIPNLIMIPCGTKAGTGAGDGKLYSALPTDGTGDFTVSRNSKGSRINSDLKIENKAIDEARLTYDTLGGCPSLLTEPQSTNLITYPISFGNPYWTKSGASIQGDASTAVGAEQIINGNFTNWTGDNPDNWIVSAENATNKITENPSGSAQMISDGADVYMYQDALTIGKFYKVDFDATVSSGSAYVISSSVGLVDTTKHYSFYYYATSVRFLINRNGACNITFDNVSVKEVQGFSSPHVDYPTSAFKLVESATLSYKDALTSVSLTSGVTYTISCFVKAGEREFCYLFLTDGTSPAAVKFNLLTGVVLGNALGSPVNSKIEALADGWYRCSMTYTSGATTSGTAAISITNTATLSLSSYTGDGTSGVYIFGAQVEQQSAATSFMYNGTEGATVTRVSDVVTGAGDVNTFNSLEGILHIETSALSNDLSERRFGLSDGTSSNVVRVGYTNISNRIIAVIYNGSNQAVMTYTPSDITQNSKIAVKYKENDFALWVDGFERSTDTNGSVFTANTLNSLSFNVGGGNHFYSDTKAIQVFKTALSNSELETLTSYSSWLSMVNELNLNVIYNG